MAAGGNGGNGSAGAGNAPGGIGGTGPRPPGNVGQDAPVTGADGGGGGGGAGGQGGAGALATGGTAVSANNGGAAGTAANPNGDAGGAGGVNTDAGGGGGGGGYSGNGAGSAGFPGPALTGGNGGAGGAGATSAGNTGGGGGGGGEGGYGAVITGTNATNTTTITGGDGGAGGRAGAGSRAGDGGDGGVGTDVTSPNAVLTNSGSIRGGNGGTAGLANGSGTSVGSAGRGGVGVVGSDLSLINSGTIAGGLANGGANGAARADAIDFTGGANALTLSGGNPATAGTITGDIAVTGTVTINPASNGSVLANVIKDGAGGPGALTVNAPGGLTLTGTNTYTGLTSILGGALILSGNGSIAQSATISNTSTFDVSNASADVTVQTYRASGETLLGGNHALIVTGSPSVANGLISGNGSIVVTGAGLVIGNNPNIPSPVDNTYTGGTTLNSGSLRAEKAQAFGTGRLNLNSGTLELATDSATTFGANGTGYATSVGGSVSVVSDRITTGTGVVQTLGALSIGDATLTSVRGENVNGGVAGVAFGATTLTGNSGAAFSAESGSSLSLASVTGAGRDLTLSGAGTGSIEGAITTGGGAIIKTGSGTWTLGGTNDYAGGTFLNSGTLSVSQEANLGAASGGLAFNGGTLQVTGTNFTGTTRAISWGVNGGSFDIADNNSGSGFTVSQSLNGGALTKLGTGNLTLTGQNSFAGGLTIEAGQVAIGNGGTTGSYSGDAVIDGGTLNFQRSDTFTVPGSISGTGSIVQNGPGTLIVDRANPTFTGATVIGGGILESRNAGALGSANILVANAELRTTFTGTLTNDQLGFIRAAGRVGAAAGTSATYTGRLTSAQEAGQPTPVLRFGSATDTGTVVLANTATNFAAGSSVAVDGGTLQIGNGGTAGSIGDLNVANGGVLVFDRGNAVAYGGVVSGAGAVQQAGPGTTTFTAAQSYTGLTTIAAGILAGGAANVFSRTSDTTVAAGGTLDLGGVAQAIDRVALAGGTLRNGALTGTVRSTGGTIETLGGSASLTTTAGNTTAFGLNSYTGATTVSGGTLDVEGSITASNITVGNGGTLSGTGKIGDPLIQAGGTLAPGSAGTPTGTLQIVGPLTFDAGSTYAITITPTANSRTNVTGTTAIGGGTVDVTAGGGQYATTRYTILTATGGVTGRFTRLSTTNNLVFLSPTLAYDANDVYLDIVRATTPAGTVVSFPSVGATANQRAAATGIEAIGAGALYGAVLNATAAEARAAFDAASGEIHASAVTAGIEGTRLERNAIFDRLDDAADRTTPGALAALTPFGGLAPALPAAAQGYAPVRKGYDTPTPMPPPAPTYTAWGTGFGDFGSNGSNRNAATLDRSLGGFVAGLDTRVDWAGLSAWRIGLAGGYTSDSLRVRDRASTGTFETYFGGLYAGAQYGAIDIKLGALGGGTSTNVNRSIAFAGFADATHAGYGGTIAQGFGEIGYKVGLPRGFIEPLFQGAAIHIGQNGFQEDGGAAALVGRARGTDVQTTTVGLKSEAALPFAGLPLIARAFLGWRHAFGDVDPIAVERFAAGGPAFTIAGAPIDRDAVVADVGLDYRLSQAMTIGISYDGQAGHRADDNAVRGTMEMRF